MKNKQTLKFNFVIKIITLLFALLLISLGVKAGRALKNSPYQLVNRLNFLVFGENGEVNLVSVAKEDSKIIPLPPDLKLNLVYGLGSHNLAEITQVAKDNNQKYSQLVAESVQENINIPIYGYFSDVKAIKAGENLKFWLMNVYFQGIRKKNNSSFKPADLFIFFSKVVFYPAKQLSILNYDQKKIDSIFIDRMVSGEGLTVEILNSTGQDGLAKKSSLLINKIGARAVRLADYQPVYENCQILINNQEIKNSYTVTELKLAFGCWVGRRGKEEKRADITIFLGEDYWKRVGEQIGD